MSVSVEQIKELRKATGVGILDCRKALEASDGDYDKAVAFLREKGLAKAAKRAGREAAEGKVELYDHGNGRVGVMVEINCETDFVARSDAFQELTHEIALQIAAASPKYVSENDIPEDVLAAEREIARNRSLEEGKPEKIIDRIVEGRISKFMEETVLLRQGYIRDESLTIEALLHDKIASIGENIVIRRFARWEMGEHTEGDETDEE
jgi:elongation factor Ts